jgi:hypothetical protein
MSRARSRIAESLGEMRALAAEIDAWNARWDGITSRGAHHTHIDRLTALTQDLIGKLIASTNAIDQNTDITTVYQQCRRQDERLLHVRRLWRWYADKLDQRAGFNDQNAAEKGDTASALRAADELIWSCWKTAFQAFGYKTLPAAPIPYLAPQFSASATPRSNPPPDLRPGKDDLLIEHVQRLPLPVIALPPICQRRPWWLVIAAHEAGHHVQFEIPGLEKATQDAVTAAVDDPRPWLPWCRELFADACAVLLAGPAVTWAIAELEAANPPDVCPSPSYPPPAIRLAVAHSVAEKAKITPNTTGGASAGARTSPLQGSLATSIDPVAEALLGLRPAGGPELRALANSTAKAYARGTIAAWQQDLLSASEPIPVRKLEAARFCTAGSVAAWQQLARYQEAEAGEPVDRESDDARVAHLARQVLAVLPDCAEPGTRAAPADFDAATLADSIFRDLLADVPLAPEAD